MQRSVQRQRVCDAAARICNVIQSLLQLVVALGYLGTLAQLAAAAFQLGMTTPGWCPPPRRITSHRIASLQSTCRAERAVAVCARYGPTRALTLVAVAHAMPCHACWNAGGAGTTGVRLLAPLGCGCRVTAARRWTR